MEKQLNHRLTRPQTVGHDLRAAVTAIVIAGSAPTALSQELHIGPAIRVDNGRGNAACNETTLSASKANPLELVGAWNDYRVSGAVRCGVGVSMDGGESWTDFVLRPPAPNQTAVEGDPMTAYDDRTGTLWAGAISFGGGGGVYVARKNPGSATFEPSVMAYVGGSDKCWMGAGPGHLDPTGSTRVYVGYDRGLLRSGDMGDTWQGPVSLGFGVGFLPRVGPSGEVYVAYWDWGDGVMLRRSFDGGATVEPAIRIATRMDVWGVDGTRFPGTFRVGSFSILAVDPNDGTLYCVYPDTTEKIGSNSNVDLYFAKSNDQGANWTVPVVINEDAVPHGDQFFPWLEVDLDGRIQMVYYDTRRVAQNDNQPEALIDVVYSYSDDGGATWTETFLTAQPFSSLNDGFGGGFIGDYNGLATAGNRTLPLYLSTEPNNNADVFTHVIQDGPSTSYCFGIECPCANEDPTGGCANATGSGARLRSSGSSSVAADDLVLTVDRVNPNALGLLLMGEARSNILFNNGNLCVAPGSAAIFRFPPQSAGAGGTLEEGPGIVAHSLANFPSNGHIQMGQTWNFQGWNRDNGGPCGAATNLSNAVTVTFQP